VFFRSGIKSLHELFQLRVVDAECVQLRNYLARVTVHPAHRVDPILKEERVNGGTVIHESPTPFRYDRPTPKSAQVVEDLGV
jgi:hypothetical protein